MRFLTTASVLALGGALAGCATTPNFPIEQTAGGPPPATAQGRPQTYPDLDGPYTPPRAAPTQPIQSAPIQSAPIQSGSLAPPRDPAPTATQLPPVQERYPVYTPPAPEPVAKPIVTYKPAPKPAGSGKVTNDTPAPVKVASGDTLIAISRKTGVDVPTLAKLNDLKSPYPLKRGQVIKLPANRYYTVIANDTLYAIAKRFGIDAADLAEFNEFKPGAAVRAGQKVYLPVAAKDRGAPPQPKPIAVYTPAPRQTAPSVSQTRPQTSAPARAPTQVPAPTQPSPSSQTAGPPPMQTERAPATPRTPIPYRPANPSSSYTPPATSAPRPQTDTSPSPPPTDAQITAAGRGKFVWPVRGDVLSRFGPTGGGQRNDGVNIAAQPNEAVKAAANGEVVYAGNQVPGYGNLVLIKHSDGWVTAYAHLANIDVKMRQSISQGQIIGQAGQTGSVDQTQLHFEVRYAPTRQDKARPVDPMLVLPQ